MVFEPRFNYCDALVKHLGTIEAARAVVEVLPLPPDSALQLRHDAVQKSTRSSTRIEGNPLDDAEVRRAVFSQ
ncbi:hypothetical protein NIES4071_67610 [Calothrix sp. NIES-4071]|nr:hypothetical protein NIES4071_67610 [Calothrix sp. NIES-4071]BAZ61039.1 hypothetical protein NIES4105_67570 [Calothrix sp. NIES-4105]